MTTEEHREELSWVRLLLEEWEKLAGGLTTLSPELAQLVRRNPVVVEASRRFGMDSGTKP